MHDWYVSVMGWFLGKALANSDRLKTIIAGTIAAVLTKVTGAILIACAVCAAFITPDMVNQLSLWIAGATLAMLVSLTHRDVAAPGETVPGAAMALPDPPADALGVPGDPPVVKP